VLRNRGTKQIVNYSQLIDDEVALLNAAEAKDMPQTALNHISLVPDSGRSLDYPSPGGRGEAGEILNRLKQIETSFKEIRSSQREFNKTVSLKVKRLSYLGSSVFIVIFLMLFALGYALKVHEILLQKW
jgi:hypothetical protein